MHIIKVVSYIPGNQNLCSFDLHYQTTIFAYLRMLCTRTHCRKPTIQHHTADDSLEKKILKMNWRQLMQQQQPPQHKAA